MLPPQIRAEPSRALPAPAMLTCPARSRASAAASSAHLPFGALPTRRLQRQLDGLVGGGPRPPCVVNSKFAPFMKKRERKTGSVESGRSPVHTLYTTAPTEWCYVTISLRLTPGCAIFFDYFFSFQLALQYHWHTWLSDLPGTKYLNPWPRHP